MPRSALFVACVVLMISAVSACCKALCLDNYIDVNYIGYTNLDVDTVLVRSFEGGSNFSIKIDSVYHRMQTAPDDTISTFLENMPASRDYEIVVIPHNRIYRLSNIATYKKSCQCNNQSFHEVISYKLDGISFQERVVKIKK